jgi:AcrR family transcriptional regulator
MADLAETVTAVWKWPLNPTKVEDRPPHCWHTGQKAALPGLVWRPKNNAMSHYTNHREEIIQAAARLFRKGGYQATSMRQIAQEAGCSLSAPYYHFPQGKQALLDAVLDSYSREWSRVSDSSESAASLGEYLQNTAPPLLSVVRRAHWFIAESHSLPEKARQQARQMLITWQRSLAESLRRFTPKAQAADDLAWIVLVTVLGFDCLTLWLHPESACPGHVVQLEAVLTGLLTCEPFHAHFVPAP